LRAKKVAFFLTTSGIELKKGLAAGASRRFSKKMKNVGKGLVSKRDLTFVSGHLMYVPIFFLLH